MYSRDLYITDRMRAGRGGGRGRVRRAGSARRGVVVFARQVHRVGDLHVVGETRVHEHAAATHKRTEHRVSRLALCEVIHIIISPHSSTAGHQSSPNRLFSSTVCGRSTTRGAPTPRMPRRGLHSTTLRLFGKFRRRLYPSQTLSWLITKPNASVYVRSDNVMA